MNFTYSIDGYLVGTSSVALSSPYLRTSQNALDPRTREILAFLKPLPLSLSEKAAINCLENRDGLNADAIEKLKKTLKEMSADSLDNWNSKRRVSPELSAALQLPDKQIKKISTMASQEIEVSPEDELEKYLFTHSLAGCYVTIILTEDDSGKRAASLTHYPPYVLIEHLLDIKDKIDLNHSNKNSSTGVIFAPAFESTVSKIKRETYIFREPTAVDLISVLLKKKLGSNAEVLLQPYVVDDLCLLGPDGGSILLKVPPKGKGNPSYRTWFNKREVYLDPEPEITLDFSGMSTSGVLDLRSLHAREPL